MNGPAIWWPLLNHLEEADETLRFIVVGGCVRDHLLGLTPKDFDIAVAIHGLDNLEALAESIENLPQFDGTRILSDRAAGYEETQAGKLVGVIETNWTFNDVTSVVQIIARPGFAGGPVQGVSQFDWGILQCWWERGDAVPGQTQIAKDDLESRTATLTQRDEGLVSRSIERFWSFDKRHPGVLSPVYRDGEAIPKQEDFGI